MCVCVCVLQNVWKSKTLSSRRKWGEESGLGDGDVVAVEKEREEKGEGERGDPSNLQVFRCRACPMQARKSAPASGLSMTLQGWQVGFRIRSLLPQEGLSDFSVSG